MNILSNALAVLLDGFSKTQYRRLACPILRLAIFVLDMVVELFFPATCTLGVFVLYYFGSRYGLVRRADYYLVYICSVLLVIVSLYAMSKMSLLKNLPLIWRRLKLGSAVICATDHGDTLCAVLQGIQKETCEYFAMFTPDYNKILECTSFHPSEVNIFAIGEQLRGNPGCVVVHNHPSVVIPFSFSDIAMAVLQKASKSIVVAGDMVYMMEFPKSVWKLDWIDVRRRGAKLNKDLCVHIGKEKEVEDQIKLNKKMAKEYGYVFTTWTMEEFLRSLEK